MKNRSELFVGAVVLAAATVGAGVFFLNSADANVLYGACHYSHGHGWDRGRWDGGRSAAADGARAGRAAGLAQGEAEALERLRRELTPRARTEGGRLGRVEAERSLAEKKGLEAGLAEGENIAQEKASTVDFKAGRDSYRNEKFSERPEFEEEFSQEDETPDPEFVSLSPEAIESELDALLEPEAVGVARHVRFRRIHRTWRYHHVRHYPRYRWRCNYNNYWHTYRSSYERSYRGDYQRAYNDAYKSAVAETLNRIRRTKSEQVYRELVAKFKDQAYNAIYLSKYNAAFNRGKLEGYRNHYPRLQTEYNDKGRIYEAAKFDEQPLRLLDLTVAMDAEGVISFRAKIRNFASKTLSKEALEFVITPMKPETIVADSEYQKLARDIRGKSLVTVKDILPVRLKVDSQAEAVYVMVSVRSGDLNLGEKLIRLP